MLKMIKKLRGKIKQKFKRWIDSRFRAGDYGQFLRRGALGIKRLLKYRIDFFGGMPPRICFNRAVYGRHDHYFDELGNTHEEFRHYVPQVRYSKREARYGKHIWEPLKLGGAF